MVMRAKLMTACGCSREITVPTHRTAVCIAIRPPLKPWPVSPTTVIEPVRCTIREFVYDGHGSDQDGPYEVWREVV